MRSRNQLVSYTQVPSRKESETKQIAFENNDTMIIKDIKTKIPIVKP